MKCELCEKEYTEWEEYAGDCPHCWSEYRQWVANGMTPEWNKILGNTEEDRSTVPRFEEWRMEAMIRKALKDGRITYDEAKRQGGELKERLRKFYNPTREDIEEMWRAHNAPAATDTSYRSIPSLFD